MAIFLYNTLTRAAEEFQPLVPGKVGLYTCGPTVYNYLHVGNYRTYIFEDVLKRTLKFLGLQVRHVMNVTDVGHLTSQADEGEDKMAVAAKREGKTAWDIAKFYEKTFLEDIKRLNIDFDPSRPDDILCRATDHIKEQTELVDKLVEKGLTYEIPDDGIYFDTLKYKASGGKYERLIGSAHIEGLKEGARVKTAGKKSSTDFALWKFSPAAEKRQMEWEYRGRKGFPGWHIECSAMAMKYLGETFDIHCGGVDHVPIHHTNEIAQAEGATGKEFAKCWMHGEFLLMNKAKMAKSEGGFIRLQDLEEKGFDPLDYRCYCYTAHYRKQLDFSWEALEAAKKARSRLMEKVAGWKARGEQDLASGSENVWAYLTGFKSRLADDLDVPGALGALYLGLSGLDKPKVQLAIVREADKVLGLGLLDPPKIAAIPPEVQKLIEEYAAARARKDFESSDLLRRRIVEQGFEIRDTKSGPECRKP